ncbi:YadA family autotransporter adhesin, partial [Burkholderia glumae]
SSTDAVNGRQLNAAKQDISANTNAIGALSTSTQTSISTLSTGLTTNTSAIASLSTSTGQSVSTLTSGLASTNSNVSALQTGLSTGTIGVVQQAGGASTGTITVGAGTGGTAVNVTGTAGARQIQGVAAGTSATDAVNLQQLQGAEAQTTAVGASTVAYDDASHTHVTLGTAGTPATLTNLADGALSTSSTDAVNGRQLNAAKQDISANTNAIGALSTSTQTSISTLSTGLTTNTSAIASLSTGTSQSVSALTTGLASTNSNVSALQTGLSTGTIGVVQQAGGASTSTITVGAGTGGTAVDVTGLAGARQIKGVAAGTSATDAVNLQQVQSMTSAMGSAAGAVGYVDASHSRVVLGAVGTPVTVTNVADGALSSGSTDAVSGRQLYAANQAIAANATAIGNLSTATAATLSSLTNSTAQSLNSLSTDVSSNQTTLSALQAGLAAGTVGLVRQASGLATGTIAIGAGTGGTAINVVGTAGARQLKGVAAGTGATDAVNLQQLDDALSAGGPAGAGSIGYDDASRTRVTFGGAGTPVSLTNIADAALSPASTDAVTGRQLFATNQSVSALAGQLAAGTVGLVQQVGGTTAALAIGAGTAGSSIDVAGTAGPRRITGVAAGVDVTDAANVGQLQQLAGAVGTLASGALAYDGPTKLSVTLGGLGAGTAVTIHNLAAGALSAGSLDAVNGGQLFATNQILAANTAAITSLSSQLGAILPSSFSQTNAIAAPASLKYAAFNSAGAGAVATGTDAVAIGATAVASGERAVSLGAGAASAGTGSVALGDSASAKGANSVALGAGSVADQDNAVSIGNAATGMTRILSNVSPGVAPTDAVNVQQLNDSVTGLANQIEHDRRDANGGIAAAVAMASLPQAPAPGKTMVAIGGGTYAGQSAMAVGVSTYAGRWVLKASGSTNSRGTVAAGFGAGYTW